MPRLSCSISRYFLRKRSNGRITDRKQQVNRQETRQTLIPFRKAFRMKWQKSHTIIESNRQMASLFASLCTRIHFRNHSVTTANNIYCESLKARLQGQAFRDISKHNRDAMIIDQGLFRTRNKLSSINKTEKSRSFPSSMHRSRIFFFFFFGPSNHHIRVAFVDDVENRSRRR